MSVIVMVDSGASVSKKILKEHNIALLPYNIMFNNGDCYKDTIDVKNQKQLISLIEEYEEIPKIDQASKQDIEDCFRKYINNGDDILYISVSSKLSNAYKEVLEVSKNFNESMINVIDSLNVGVGETSLAIYAKEYINRGYGLKQTAKYLNNIKHMIKSCYAVGNPLYLYKQQRYDVIEDKYMEFHQCVPIFEINDGKIVATFNAKEKELALQMLKNMILDYSKNLDCRYLIIAYSGDKKVANNLKSYASKLIDGLNVEIVENSSVVFINSGMNTLSLSFLLDKKESYRDNL